MLLHDLAEIRELWGFSENKIYRAVALGELRAYGRPGRQKYYSRAELVALFGEPTNRVTPPALKRRDNRSDVTGGQLSFGELAGAARAA